MSKQEKQSPEAVPKLESAILSLDEPEFEDFQSLVLFQLPTAVPSSGLVRALGGLEGGLEDSCLPCLVSGINSGM